MLIAMGYLLYKNRHRAKAFLLSFFNFEAVLVVEVRPTHRLVSDPSGDDSITAVLLFTHDSSLAALL